MKKEKKEKRPITWDSATFTPRNVCYELKNATWAKWRSTSKTPGIFKNFICILIFVVMFALFFELCALISAGLFKLM